MAVPESPEELGRSEAQVPAHSERMPTMTIQRMVSEQYSLPARQAVQQVGSELSFGV